MGRISEKERQRLLGSKIRLIRNTMWKCGKWERLVIRLLHERMFHFKQTTVKDIRQAMNNKKGFFNVLRRLEKRGIVRLDSKP